MISYSFWYWNSVVNWCRFQRPTRHRSYSSTYSTKLSVCAQVRVPQGWVEPRVRRGQGSHLRPPREGTGGGTKKNNSLKNMLRRLFYALIEMLSSYLQIFSAKTLVYFNVKSCVSSVYKLSTEWGLTCPKFQFVFQRLFLPCLGREEEVQREWRAVPPLAGERELPERGGSAHPRPHAPEQQRQAAQPVRRLGRRCQQGRATAPLR